MQLYALKKLNITYSGTKLTSCQQKKKKKRVTSSKNIVKANETEDLRPIMLPCKTQTDSCR